MEHINHGILTSPPRPTDYILGANSPIKIDRCVKDWSIYLPANETQRSSKEDFLICATMSALHSIECQLNYLLSEKQFSDEALFFFHNNGYIQDGSFCLSDRFNAQLNGTEKLKGNYLNKVGDFIRQHGILPGIDWPIREDMSWVEFYSDIPIGLFSKARKALWFLDIKYQWINKTDLAQGLNLAPVQIATAICPGWNGGKLVEKCSSQTIQHATVIYGYDEQGNWLNLDHYQPYRQKLAPDYEFPLNMQYIVTAKPLCLRKGMYGSNVLQLQKDLNKLGFNLKEDSDYGLKTETAVKNIQNKTALVSDGIAGPKTLAKIKELNTPRSLVDAIILVESGGNDYAVGDKNLENKAYGALQIRKPYCDDINSHFSTNYKAIDCLGNRKLSIWMFERYMEIYGQGKTDEQKSRMHNSGPRGAKIPLPNPELEKKLQNYWNKVKKFLYV